MYDVTKIGENIATHRKEHGLSQEELAEKLFVSRQAVSKWERGEALPDTENLIALSNLFEVTLDELIKGVSERVQTDEEGTPKNDDLEPFVYKIETPSEKVVITDKCTVIANKDENSVSIELHKKERSLAQNTAFILGITPYTIVVTIAFLLWGFCGGWNVSWTLYLTIPVYYSIIDSIKTKQLEEFAYPVLLVFIYCLLGMLYGIWHPLWIIFLTIPIYYCIVEPIDKRRRKK